jgi:hypothetical protein
MRQQPPTPIGIGDRVVWKAQPSVVGIVRGFFHASETFVWISFPASGRMLYKTARDLERV